MKTLLAILLLAATSAFAQSPNDELIATRQQREAASNQVAALVAMIEKISKELADAKKAADSCKPVEGKK